jgi:hypothetical protein
MNNETKHTPGPWEIGKSSGGDFTIYRYESNTHIGEVYSTLHGDGERGKANAALIAAAPELLEACKEALRQLGASDCPPIPDGAMVRGKLYNAIAKAQGR